MAKRVLCCIRKKVKNLIGKTNYNYDKVLNYACDDEDSNYNFAWKLYKQGSYQAAFKAFENSNKTTRELNMAYMLRKKLVYDDKYSVEKLLKPLVEKNNSFAIVNYTLCYIENNSWEAAIELLSRINVPDDEIINWWHNLSLEGDKEGDLVLGLLMYIGKLENDPNGISAKERLSIAVSAGYKIPDYIIDEVS